MKLDIDSESIRYFFGEPLISMNRFAELFLFSLAYEDGVLDINEDTVKAKLPYDYEDKITEYIDNVGNKREIAAIIDLAFYYNNTDIWFKEMNSMLNYYVQINKKIKLDPKSDPENIIITMPTDLVFNKMNKVDKDVTKYIIDLTTYVNKKEENELEHFRNLIESVGIEKVKTK